MKRKEAESLLKHAAKFGDAAINKFFYEEAQRVMNVEPEYHFTCTHNLYSKKSAVTQKNGVNRLPTSPSQWIEDADIEMPMSADRLVTTIWAPTTKEACVRWGMLIANVKNGTLPVVQDCNRKVWMYLNETWTQVGVA